MNDYDYLFKISIIGDSSVGKSSLLLKYSDDIFYKYLSSTIGVDFRSKIIKLDDKKFKLQIWDTTGQEQFKPILKFYIGESNGIIIMYDITNPNSFNNIKSWLKYIEYEKSPYIPVIIVGNKIDITAERKVTYEEAIELANEFDIEFIEISVKENKNVDKIFNMIVNEIKNNFINNRQTFPLQKYKNITKQNNNLFTCCSNRKSNCILL